MVFLQLLVGLAIATTVTAESVVKVWLPNLSPPNFRPTLLGSIISSNEDSTTVAVHCPSRLSETVYCPIFNHMTVTYGPSTLGFIYTQYQDSDTYTDLRLIETMGCIVYPSSAVCRDTFTDAGGEGGWSDTGTITFTDLETYTTRAVTIAITAGAAVTTTTTTAELTSTKQATPGSSSTLAVTASSTPLPTPETTSIFPNATSHFSTSASLTNAESTTNTGSIPSSIVTVNAAYSLSGQHPGIIGIAAFIGAAVILI